MKKNWGESDMRSLLQMKRSSPAEARRVKIGGSISEAVYPSFVIAMRCYTIALFKKHHLASLNEFRGLQLVKINAA
jgi:hypothetical protein